MTPTERLKRCEGCEHQLAHSTDKRLDALMSELDRYKWSGCNIAKTLCRGVDTCPIGREVEDERNQDS
jgi:hypothetical protein